MSCYKLKLNHYSLVWSGSLENGVTTQLFSPSGQHLKLQEWFKSARVKEIYVSGVILQHKAYELSELSKPAGIKYASLGCNDVIMIGNNAGCRKILLKLHHCGLRPSKLVLQTCSKLALQGGVALVVTANLWQTCSASEGGDSALLVCHSFALNLTCEICHGKIISSKNQICCKYRCYQGRSLLTTDPSTKIKAIKPTEVICHCCPMTTRLVPKSTTTEFIKLQDKI
ncbi:hypothetical protein AVEN_211792-1 [Araneus ventricosus]|uniref:Uncharacterized protein n=1 Tax=Araneus ventricosus TaxID=182803 RepID=A0A4Y2RCK7_ARAVE|nr:hypothetical protein AVEN_211792-1 [Araneus ventricosus]